jgi:hypothetical protein
MILDWLVNGAIGGAVVSLVAFVLSRFVHDVIGRVWLAFVLVAAAFFYLMFASRADAGTAWLIGEVVGIVIYGGMGVLGIRRSPMWLAAGWALHPVWDMLLHHVGPGRSFTPEAYPISCVSWDLLVAAYIAAAYGFGLVGGRRSGLRAERAVRGTAL